MAPASLQEVSAGIAAAVRKPTRRVAAGRAAATTNGAHKRSLDAKFKQLLERLASAQRECDHLRVEYQVASLEAKVMKNAVKSLLQTKSLAASFAA